MHLPLACALGLRHDKCPYNRFYVALYWLFYIMLVNMKKELSMGQRMAIRKLRRATNRAARKLINIISDCENPTIKLSLVARLATIYACYRPQKLAILGYFN